MNVREYGVLFWVVVGILALLVASPALSRLLVYPRTEFFTELWLLDANHGTEEYPANISRGENYSVFLGVGNRLGYCASYVVQVKFRNQTQPAPTSFGPVEERVPSSLRSLFDVRVFVADDQVWEMPLTVSFDYGFNETLMRVELTSFSVNGATVDLDGNMVVSDAVSGELRGFLFFELWLYDAAVDGFRYHGRFLQLSLNMTV